MLGAMNLFSFHLRNRASFLVIFAMLLALAGCSNLPSTRAYDGPELPETEVAIVKGVVGDLLFDGYNETVRTISINGKEFNTVLPIAVKPGRLSFIIQGQTDPQKEPLNPLRCSYRGRFELEWEVERGFTYTFRVLAEGIGLTNIKPVLNIFRRPIGAFGPFATDEVHYQPPAKLVAQDMNCTT